MQPNGPSEINVLKLSELEAENKAKKERKAQVQDQEQDAIEFNILEAISAFTQPITVKEFWTNPNFTDILTGSITSLLSLN